MVGRFVGVVAVALAAAAPAHAQGPYEPNDGYSTAFGPLAAAQDYEAVIETRAEEDWYVMTATATQTATVTVTALEDPCGATVGSVSGWLKDQGLNSSSTSGDFNPGNGQTQTFTKALTAGQKYYLHVFTTSCAGVRYRFNIGPAGVIGTPPSSNPTPNPSPSPTSTPSPTPTQPTQPKPPVTWQTIDEKKISFGSYSCLHQSQAYTGFAEPTLRFTIKKGGKWTDRTFKKPIVARYKTKGKKLTLYTAKGRKLYTFTPHRDARGRYLREVTKRSDKLICRKA